MDRNVDAIAAAYIHSAQGNCLKALQLAIADALADLLEAERRTLHAARLISHGYARGEFGLGRSEEQRQPWHHGETSRTSHRIRRDDTRGHCADRNGTTELCGSLVLRRSAFDWHRP